MPRTSACICPLLLWCQDDEIEDAEDEEEEDEKPKTKKVKKTVNDWELINDAKVRTPAAPHASLPPHLARLSASLASHGGAAPAGSGHGWRVAGQVAA